MAVALALPPLKVKTLPELEFKAIAVGVRPGTFDPVVGAAWRGRPTDGRRRSRRKTRRERIRDMCVAGRRDPAKDSLPCIYRVVGRSIEAPGPWLGSPMLVPGLLTLLQAPAPAPRPLTLDEAISRALARRGQVTVAASAVAVARAGVRLAGQIPNPT